MFSFLFGLFVYAVVRVGLRGFFTVRPDQRAVKTSFGRAHRMPDAPGPEGELTEAERERYRYPRLQVIPPGGPYLRMPWQTVHKISVATQAVDISWDPTKDQSTIEAVTKDHLTTGVNGQLRYRVSENNLYPYLFGVNSPLEHVMGYFVSVLRERITKFTDPREQAAAPVPSSLIDLHEGVSINDLRKNLPLLNQYMEEQCRSTAGRYGIELDAALVTEINPPPEVDHALSAINSTRNQVAADISTARADAEQQITMSERAVEIARNNAEAEVAPLKELASILTRVKASGGPSALPAYLRYLRVPLFGNASRVVFPADGESP